MSDLASDICEVAVTLPDGAVRRYPAGVTPARDRRGHLEIAGQGGAGGVVDGRLVGPVAADPPRRLELRIVTAKDEVVRSWS